MIYPLVVNAALLGGAQCDMATFSVATAVIQTLSITKAVMLQNIVGASQFIISPSWWLALHTPRLQVGESLDESNNKFLFVLDPLSG